MKDGWFNRILGRNDDTYEFNTHDEDSQGLHDEGIPVKKRGWFTSLYRRVSGKELEDEFRAHQERMEDAKYRDALFGGFDDDWLISEFKEIHGIVTEVEVINNLIEDPPELIVYKGQYYLPLEGTIHEADLRYQMEHSN